MKAGPQIETWQGRSAAAFTPAVILFIALPEAEDNIEPGTRTEIHALPRPLPYVKSMMVPLGKPACASAKSSAADPPAVPLDSLMTSQI